MATVSHKIERFDPRTLPDAGVVMFIGRSGSGKTYAINDIVYHKRRFPLAIGIFGSEDTAAEFSEKIPDLFIHSSWDEKMMTDIYEKQERDVRMKRASPLLIIIDDLMHQKNLLEHSKVMQRIFFSGRHARILLLLSMQYCKNLGPDMRQQVQFTFVTYEKLPVNRRRLYDTFNNVFHTFTEFDAVMQALTQDYTMMVLSNIFNASDSIQENVFWYKARKHRKYRVGKHGPMWRRQRRDYDPMFFMRGHEDELAADGCSGPQRTKITRHKRRVSTVFVEQANRIPRRK
jgi:hypothetical protein